ncbi:MAG: amidohydrolase family protein, partial [Armatimonadaceae bacterium]
DGTYDIGGHAAKVADGKALLPDGTLAGSILTMDKAAHHLRLWCGAEWPEVVRMTSTNAAERMGWDSKGWIRPGYDADLVALDDSGNAVLTMVAGRIAWRANESSDQT